jgi:Rrf2 family protein
MKFSTKTRYGVRAILEIALNNNPEGIYQKEIAQNQDISYKYLDQIMNSLKLAGLITKAEGPKRGYILTRKASEITVFDIHTAFEPEICVIDCLAPGFSCDRDKYCVMKGFWGNLNNHIIKYFKSTTIEHLKQEQVKLDELVKYQQ